MKGICAAETRGSTTIARIYTIDPQGNRLLGFTQQISGPAGTSSAAVNYTYNDNGDLTGDGLAQYSLNAEGRISSVTQGNTDTSPTTRYAHNALGQRTFKTEPLYENIPEQPGEQGFWASLMAFFSQLWSPAVVPAEQLGWAYVYDEAGTLLGEYGTGGAQSTGSTQHVWVPTASGPMPIAAIVNGSAYAVHADHLNTPRQLTNAQGQVAWQWRYSAFGDERPTKAVNRFVDPVANPGAGTGAVADVNYNLRYPGQYADAESGLHYNYFRSYDARIGRYTQPDPIGLDGGWHRFGYVAQNPLRFTDPTGQYSREYMDLDAYGRPVDDGSGGGGGGSGYVPDVVGMAPPSFIPPITPVSPGATPQQSPSSPGFDPNLQCKGPSSKIDLPVCEGKEGVELCRCEYDKRLILECKGGLDSKCVFRARDLQNKCIGEKVT